MGKLIFMWAPVSLHHLLHWDHQKPSNLSDSDNTDEAVNIELLLLLNLQGLEKVRVTEVVLASDSLLC